VTGYVDGKTKSGVALGSGSSDVHPAKQLTNRPASQPSSQPTSQPTQQLAIQPASSDN